MGEGWHQEVRVDIQGIWLDKAKIKKFVSKSIWAKKEDF